MKPEIADTPPLFADTVVETLLVWSSTAQHAGEGRGSLAGLLQLPHITAFATPRTRVWPRRRVVLWSDEQKEGSVEKMSMSHEDYLEAIVMLGGTTDVSVRSVDIATKLGVSKASVNKAVSSLKEKGLADQPYYGDITLTEEGFAYGTSVLDRHHMLFTFLTKALGIPEEQAEKEACLMEHAISDESFKKWSSYINKLAL